MENTEIKRGGSFGNVGTLDLRNATEKLVASISLGNVGTLVYSPETAHLVSRLRMGNVGRSIEIATEARFISGHVNIDRDFFKSGSEPLTYFVNGHVIVEADVPRGGNRGGFRWTRRKRPHPLLGASVGDRAFQDSPDKWTYSELRQRGQTDHGQSAIR